MKWKWEIHIQRNKLYIHIGYLRTLNLWLFQLRWFKRPKY